MKKFLIFILFTFLSLNIVIVKAESTLINYDFTILDDYCYNLETGAIFEDEVCSISNKVLVNDLADYITFGTINFNHILYWKANGQYLGYQNTSSNDRQEDNFIIGDISSTVSPPEDAHTFAIMGYDYRERLMNQYFTVEYIFGDTMTYYGGEHNLLLTDYFNNDYPLGNQAYFEYVGKNIFNLSDLTLTSTTYSILNNSLNIIKDIGDYYVGSTNELIIKSSTNYNLNFDYVVNDNGDNDYTILVTILQYNGPQYVSEYSENLPNLSGNKSINFTTSSYTDNIRLRFNRQSYDTDYIDITYNNIQIEEGSSATTYESFELSEYIGYEKRRIYDIYDTDTYQYIDRDFNDVVQSATNWTLSQTDTTTYRFEKDLTSSLGNYLPTDGGVNPANIYLKIGDTVLPVYTQNGTPNQFTLDVESVVLTTTGVLRIKILQSKLTGNTSSDFETFLQANDVEFIFELDTPIEYLPFLTYDRYLYSPDLDVLFNMEEDDFLPLPPFSISDNDFSYWVNNYLLDPYDYTTYYNTTFLESIVASYYYDLNPVEPDVSDSINNYADSINLNAVYKVLIALAIMVALAITITKFTDSLPIILLLEVTVYLVFTILGWFPIWIVILLAIILSIIMILKLVKGGGSSE